ncbi:MAG: hypothetical protein QG623_423 [Patescibacteria group bacterium]|nr:hypothetical protein [Patescibacteria group bacterium]MDQ5913804.1 hypothetical protein [Patescibacteria group bacterium]
MDDVRKELIDEQVYSWLEVHKKSALSYIILLALNDADKWSQQLTEWIYDKTSWTVTEKGLYRILRRMQQTGLVGFKEVSAKRTGAKRKQYHITPEGKVLLSKIKEQLQYLTLTVNK